MNEEMVNNSFGSIGDEFALQKLYQQTKLVYPEIRKLPRFRFVFELPW